MPEVPTVLVDHPDHPGLQIRINKDEYEADKARYKIAKSAVKKAVVEETAKSEAPPAKKSTATQVKK